MLINKAGVWKSKPVILPKQNEKGIIKISNEVLGIENNSASPGNVSLGEIDQNNEGQIWKRGIENVDGYFILLNPKAKLYLTATGENTLQIQGKFFTESTSLIWIVWGHSNIMLTGLF